MHNISSMTMIRPHHHSQQRREPIFLVSIVGIGFLLFFCLRISHLLSSSSSSSSSSTKSKSYNNIQDVITKAANGDFDVILVLGGGVPSTLYEPPLYVQRRCDDAAAIRGTTTTTTPILTLSAGTAHLPQLLTKDGLPIWESTSSAAYLQQKHGIQSQVYLETTSYDTIGNAFFARTSHTDIVGWRKLLIITNEFHMDRTKVIFDWIFGIADGTKKKRRGYQLSYFASPDIGLTDEALQARRVHEQRSTEAIRQKLAPQYQTLPDLWKFVNENHDLYTAKKLIDGATQVNSARDDALKASYGGGGTK